LFGYLLKVQNRIKEILHNMGILNNVRTLFFLYSLTVAYSSDAFERNGTAASNLNAEMLVSLGRKLNKPLITVIGKVMENYHLRTDWSEWTNCGAMNVNFFATRSRTRHCALIQSQNGENIPEEETDVCEGICPANYILTRNGFCLKLHSTPSNRNDAEAMCKTSGGSLINIDRDSKYNDVKALLTAYDEKQNIHIDGRRINSTSSWEYSYGYESGYFHWFGGNPTTVKTWLCLVMSGYRTIVNQRFRWFNNPCASKYAFVCEAHT
jgi:hypothetical protein